MTNLRVDWKDLLACAGYACPPGILAVIGLITFRSWGVLPRLGFFALFGSMFLLLLWALYSEGGSEIKTCKSKAREVASYKSIEIPPIRSNNESVRPITGRSVSTFRVNQTAVARNVASANLRASLVKVCVVLKPVVQISINKKPLPIVKPGILYPSVPNPPRIIGSRSLGLAEVFVVAQKAQLREITWNIGGQQKILRKFQLSFPPTVFRIVFYGGTLDSVYVFYSKSDLSGPHSRVYSSNLCNVAPNGCVCLGKGVDELRAEIRRFDSNTQIQHVVNHFWYGSAFDLNHLPSANFIPWKKIEPKLSSLETWEKQSLRNPVFVLSIDWARRGISWSVEDILDPYYQ